MNEISLPVDASTVVAAIVVGISLALVVVGAGVVCGAAAVPAPVDATPVTVVLWSTFEEARTPVVEGTSWVVVSGKWIITVIKAYVPISESKCNTM